MSKLDPRETYLRHVERHKEVLPYDTAMRHAIGGDFDANGVIERELLIQQGLRRGDFLVDVGCGSGRLAVPLSEYLTGRYLGIDIVPELVEYAARIVNRPDWRFEPASGFTIPAADGEADMVCFFSVLTHLLHEESYLYLADAKRVLKPGGTIVFTFVEFANPHHWSVFEDSIRHAGDAEHPLNVFISRDAIELWAQKLGLEVELVRDSVEPHIPIPHAIRYDDGRVTTGAAHLGQSIAVLRRAAPTPTASEPPPAVQPALRAVAVPASADPATHVADAALAARIAAFPRWHYAFELRGHSTVTPGVTQVHRHARRLPYLLDPLTAACGGTLRGRRVLDLACNAGFWSLAALRRGADFVLGVGASSMHIEQAALVLEVENVDAARFRLVTADVMAADWAAWGAFDVVLCFGLLHRVERPGELLARIAATGARHVVVDTPLSKLPDAPPRSDPSSGEASGFWPSPAAVIALAADQGYHAEALEPAFDDWDECEDYRDGRRRGFLLTRV